MKYQPLQDYLRAVPANKQHVALRFERIEKIIRAKLPRSAYIYREWWANQRGGSRAPHWRAAGFRVEAVDLSLMTVRFARTGNRIVTKRMKSKTPKKRAPNQKPMKLEVLTNAGFKEYGHWKLSETGIHLDGNLPREPGVYAHAVDGDVQYIGRSLKGFKHRMGHYKNPGRTQRTSIRINSLIKTALQSGKIVQTFAAFPKPSTWNGLPVES